MICSFYVCNYVYHSEEMLLQPQEPDFAEAFILLITLDMELLLQSINEYALKQLQYEFGIF